MSDDRPNDGAPLGTTLCEMERPNGRSVRIVRFDYTLPGLETSSYIAVREWQRTMSGALQAGAGVIFTEAEFREKFAPCVAEASAALETEERAG